jgi:hypothetical protein
VIEPTNVIQFVRPHGTSLLVLPANANGIGRFSVPAR